MIDSADPKPALWLARRSTAFVTILAAAILGVAPVANAQDWGEDENEDWSESQPNEPRPRATTSQSPRGNPADKGWSIRSGLGFTTDPTTFLLNVEAPYALDSWIAVGPMLQLGLEQDNTLVMPTANVTLKVPDLPGRDFDRLTPYGFAGIGMAYIEREKRGDDRDGAGFLITTGFGIEYQVSERVFFGSQMMLNFLPSKTQGETFIYSWQMGGIRFAF
jgi:hypothetical protein